MAKWKGRNNILAASLLHFCALIMTSRESHLYVQVVGSRFTFTYLVSIVARVMYIETRPVQHPG